MTKNEIIGTLATGHVVEDIITNITKGKEDDTLKDLAQMIYEWLLETEEEKIVSMYEKKQLNYYISRIATNNIKSKNSRYYYLFKKPEMHDDIKDLIYGESKDD